MYIHQLLSEALFKKTYIGNELLDKVLIFYFFSFIFSFTFTSFAQEA